MINLRSHAPMTVGAPGDALVREQRMQHDNDILVVDDDVHIAEFLCDVLVEEGYTVRVAHDGASALLAIKQRCPALVMLDVAMPVMVGDELLRYLRSHGYADLPVIMMTASLQPERYLACGATRVLPKPFDVEVLLECVARYVPQSAQQAR
jgi:CheY-like chemotaxis protein